MAKRFVVPFATSGDKSVTPDATALDGSISYSQGWPSAYQLPDTDPNYRPVGRQEMNGVFNDITGALAELQIQGFPTWVQPAGLVPPYQLNATVRYAVDNKNYRSTIINNSTVPGTNSDWVDVDAAPPLHGIARFTASNSLIVPAGVTQMTISGVAPGGGGGGGGGALMGLNVGSGGGGGGAGESLVSAIYAVSPGSLISFTMGAPGLKGIGVSGANGTAGTDGGNVVINGLVAGPVTLTGGKGGNLGSCATSPAGGGQGGIGFPRGGTGSDAAANGSAGDGAFGGSSPFGGGGSNGRGSSSVFVAAVSNGSDAGGFGAGGGSGGGYYTGSATTKGGDGGNGSPAFLKFEW
jgi:hypothetical protein